MMRCPYCDQEMELGYLQSARPILWDKEVLEIIIAPKNNRGFYVTKKNFEPNHFEAYYCCDCNLLVSQLKDKCQRPVCCRLQE